MTTVAQLATVPSADTPQTCIHVRHDKGHYIFGRIAEGTQRAFNSRKLGFAAVTQIFLSGPVGWDQMGGMPGFLLTIAGSVGASRETLAATNAERKEKGLKLLPVTPHGGVHIHAGHNIGHVLASSRSYIFRQPIRAHVSEHRSDPRAVDPSNLEPDWKDDMVRVWKVPTTRERSSSPPKRRRSSDDAEQCAEHPADGGAPSDPDVAKIIVERALWNGDLQSYPFEARKVGALKPDDSAFIIENGSIRRYTVGGAQDGEDPEATAWVLPPDGSPKPPPGVETRSLGRVSLPKTSYTQTAMSYIVKTHDRRGKFDRAAADALGVQRNDFKKLIDGAEVQGKDGVTVTPDMVLGRSVPGRGLIVADIAGPDYLESFMQRPEWSSEELMSDIAVMYWLLGPGLAGNERIRKFMAEHAGVKHVVCAPETTPNMVSNPGPAELQMKLRRVDPDRFPIPKYDNAVSAPAPGPDSNIEFGRAGKKVQLMPRLLHQDDAVAPFPDLVAPYNSVSDEALSLAREAKARAADPAFLARVEREEADMPNRDAEIVCLGTGSSVPSKYRNVSATLIRVPGVGNYLLDCGEGTMGQIRRLYGDEGTAEVLRNLRCVAISHLHADHHLGAVSVFRSWYEQSVRDGGGSGGASRLAVACIPRYRSTLEELSQVEDFGFHRLHFPDSERLPGSSVDEAVLGPADQLSFGLRRARLIPVRHCAQSKAVELELVSGLRIAYSGDCRPSADFAAACRGAHLLVHECTFDDDMADHARFKQHSTMSEALGVARDMGARRTLLTHFSQRYVKADSLSMAIGGESEGSVLLGFDYMTVRLGDFQKAACYLPALEKVMEKMTAPE
ncbi:ribonuclease Z [Geosmithia morbida]|uniref:ribonuclease Z n=1 Tax=Geosmithia morbida TaxID=1094350 RepID=A0A9P4YPC8_9HYPO|nr:ribonuclease Z [Geosmithia morbida]KAF4119278.1 ribonuclease Z [Geosmithia morbida]